MSRPRKHPSGAWGAWRPSRPTGAMIYEASMALRQRYPARSPMRPIIVSVAGFGAALVYSRDLLGERQSVIKRWTDDDKPASLGCLARDWDGGRFRRTRHRTRLPGLKAQHGRLLWQRSDASPGRENDQQRPVGRRWRRALLDGGRVDCTVEREDRTGLLEAPEERVRIRRTEEHLAVLRGRSAGSPVPHRRGDTGSHRIDVGGEGRRPSDPCVRRSQQRSAVPVWAFRDDARRIGAPRCVRPEVPVVGVADREPAGSIRR